MKEGEKLKSKFNGSGFLLSLVVIFLFVGVFEVYLRLTADSFEPPECFVYSERFLWENKPNCTEKSNWRFTYNNLGFRDKNYDKEKSENTFRVLLVGDSVVEGKGVGIGESMGKNLENILKKEINGKNFEVINLGRSGYTLNQEKKIIETYTKELNADLVLLNYVLNDPLDERYHPIFYNKLEDDYVSDWVKPKFYVSNWVEKKTFFVKENYKSPNCPDEYFQFLHCVYEDEIKNDFSQIKKISEKNGIPVLVFINPVYNKGNFQSYELEDLHVRLKKNIEAQGLKAYDLLEEFKKHNLRDIEICWEDGKCDEWHPNATGHKIIAEYMYNILRKENVIEK